MFEFIGLPEVGLCALQTLPMLVLATTKDGRCLWVSPSCADRTVLLTCDGCLISEILVDCAPVAARSDLSFDGTTRRVSASMHLVHLEIGGVQAAGGSK